MDSTDKKLISILRHNARVSKLLDLAGMSADGDYVVVFETNSQRCVPVDAV